jgi:preprotein translocase subunit SecB
MYFCMHILYPYRKLVDDETRDCTSGFLWINKTNFMHNNQITNSRKIETREYHTKK